MVIRNSNSNASRKEADTPRPLTVEEERRREAARREALANWEGEGGHLAPNGSGNGKGNKAQTPAFPA